MSKTEIKLPEFSQPISYYDEGGIATNPYSGESYPLNAVELTIYDLLVGLQRMVDANGGLLNPNTARFQKDMRVGLDWFRRHNAKAYMVLLD